jgi:hypothetical protein
LLTEGKVEGTNNPKFVVRLAVGNNLYDHILNDQKQSTYIFSNDVELWIVGYIVLSKNCFNGCFDAHSLFWQWSGKLSP